MLTLKLIRIPLGALLAATALALLLASGAYASKAVHVSCGQTITENTKLANDLIDCPNEGIIIGAAGITLDLNGHTIDGDGPEFPGCLADELCDTGIVNSANDGPRAVFGPGHNGHTSRATLGRSLGRVRSHTSLTPALPRFSSSLRFI